MINGPQLHLVLNHLPVVGFGLFLPVFLLALLSAREDYKRLALLGTFLLGLLALPAYFTGEPAEKGVLHWPADQQAQIESHEDAAEDALIFALITAFGGAIGWLASRRSSQTLRYSMPAVAAGVVVTAGLMAWVGHIGGLIRHPEIAREVDLSASVPK